MSLQNRVNPYGDIISTSARGAWLGNRGVIHNAEKQIVRPYRTKAWITCVLQFRGRHREVMMPDRWTELFFLDEATAFSAGHRPCFQCRYADHIRFKAAWIKGNPEYGFDAKTPINEIDKILHTERIARSQKVLFDEDIANLPNGTFVRVADEAYLLANGALHHWTAFGYGRQIDLEGLTRVAVLTPKSIVNAFKAGYHPQMAV